MRQQAKTFLTTAGVALLTGLAVVFALSTARHFHGMGEAAARVWFYDQETRRLYAAPRDLIPPEGNNEARVRAMVISFQGMGNDASQLKVAYLEKYSPELKALLERAVAARAAQRPFAEKIPSQTSAYFQDNSLVKLPGETAWHTLGSEEGRQIRFQWREWRGPAGQRPIVSVPSSE